MNSFDDLFVLIGNNLNRLGLLTAEHQHLIDRDRGRPHGNKTDQHRFQTISEQAQSDRQRVGDQHQR